MLRLEINDLPPIPVRSEQAGDWTYDKLTFHLTAVSAELGNRKSEFAILIHEIMEAFLCRESGVSDADVVKFDDQYEDERKNGHHKERDEPGDDPRAPYRQEHMAATHVERAVCMALGITWQAHDEVVQRMGEDHH
jgi:hypothetical protein